MSYLCANTKGINFASVNNERVKKFTSLLDEYIARKAEHEGLPTVAYFADPFIVKNVANIEIINRCVRHFATI